MGITGQLSGKRQQNLRALVTEAELRITEAERRIENHHTLWPRAVSRAQRGDHLKLERNLLEGLRLLHMWRSMLLDQLHGALIPRSVLSESWSELEARDRQAYLAEVIAWLDGLPSTTIAKVISEQRERAFRELWHMQKRQLWEGDQRACSQHLAPIS